MEFRSNVEVMLLPNDAWILAWYEITMNRHTVRAGQGFDLLCSALKEAKDALV